MRYSVTPSEPVPRGLKRVAREQVDFALRRLTTADNRPDAIHQTRKCIKRLRALLRLIEPQLGKVAANDNLRLRDLGRTLSASREAAAMVETFDELAKVYPAEMGLNRFAAVRAQLAKARDLNATAADSAAQAAAAAEELRKLKPRINLWRLHGDGFPLVAEGFNTTWSKGRKALRKVRKHPSAGNFHELRKRAKDHWIQVRLMNALWPDSNAKYEAAMRDLQDTLGKANNVAVLLRTPVANLAGKENGALKALAERWLDRLRAKALDAATDIYDAESPPATPEVVPEARVVPAARQNAG